MKLGPLQHASILAGVLCTFGGLLRADDPAPVDAEAEQQSAAEDTAREAGRLQFRPAGSDRDLDASADSILKWSNPDVGRVYGNVYLWTEAGRPLVAASVYQWFHPFQSLDLEICSLSERSLQGRYDDETVWNPQSEGVTWHDLGGDPPAASRPLRLIQMKRAAERFTARLQDGRTGDDVAKVLRPLATPLYRYPARGAVLDGALFAFVVGTDPELLLLIESENDRWRYGIARMNRDALQVSLDEQVVESYDHLDLDEMFDSRNPYFVMNARAAAQTSAAPQRQQLIEEEP